MNPYAFSYLVCSSGRCCGRCSWKLFLIVGNHNHRLVLSLAECLDDILHQAAVSVVKTMKRLVEDEELGILHEGTCQKYQALLATDNFRKPRSSKPSRDRTPSSRNGTGPYPLPLALHRDPLNR